MKRPWAVTILGAVFIFAGAVGLVYHVWNEPFTRELLLVSLVRVIAVVGGVFLVLGHNWARWVLLAWMALHVGISLTHSVSETVAHLLLLLVIGYFLLTPPGAKYFRKPLPE